MLYEFQSNVQDRTDLEVQPCTVTLDTSAQDHFQRSPSILEAGEETT